jgi:PTS system nitrogen regulatory IIA component
MMAAIPIRRSPAVPFGTLTLPELARHLGIDARELQRWAEKGKLPGRMVGGAWRFNEAEMLDWAQSELQNLDEKHIRELEQSMTAGSRDLLISPLLPLDGVEMNLPARSRDSVLRELTQLATRTGMLYDGPGLLAALQQREELCSTALPKGLAIPHPRRPLESYAMAEPFICVARVPAGVPFSAPDGRLTDLFVLVVAGDERQHLGILARLALMFTTTKLADELRDTIDRDTAIASLISAERSALRIAK